MSSNINAADSMSAYLKSIANHNRLKVLQILSKGEVSVSEINEQLDLSQSALSQHLAVMRREQVVHTRRSSQTIYYSLNEELPTRHLMDVLKNLVTTDGKSSRASDQMAA